MDQSVTTSFRLPKEVDDELDRIATDAGLSKGKWVREYIMLGLQAATEEKPTQLDELKRCAERLHTIDARLSAAEQLLGELINLNTSREELLRMELADLKVLLEQVVKANTRSATRLAQVEIALRDIYASTRRQPQQHRDIGQSEQELASRKARRGQGY